MKKDKEKKKKTVYAIMVEQFINAGYEVKEDWWIENIGYGKPTTEYWFDVIIKKENNTVYVLHYWFGSDLDKLISVEAWTYKIVTTETDHKNLF